MKALLKADGLTALVMHNERLADPLDEHTKKIAERSKKRGKTEEDHEYVAYWEFKGGLYTNGNGPCLPAWNVLRCLQDGAKRHKRGQDVLRGVYPLTDHADVEYDGPRDPEDLWKVGGFSLRKTVGVQRSRVMRTRPFFIDWQLELPIEVDVQIWNLGDLRHVWGEAGKYAGLCEMRPVYGRFAATIDEVKS